MQQFLRQPNSQGCLRVDSRDTALRSPEAGATGHAWGVGSQQEQHCFMKTSDTASIFSVPNPLGLVNPALGPELDANRLK